MQYIIKCFSSLSVFPACYIYSLIIKLVKKPMVALKNKKKNEDKRTNIVSCSTPSFICSLIINIQWMAMIQQEW